MSISSHFHAYPDDISDRNQRREGMDARGRATSQPAKPRLRSQRRMWIIYVLGGIIAALVALRLAAPYLVLTFLNNHLVTLPGYHGHIGSVSLHLYRGAYQLNQVSLFTTDGPTPSLSLDCRRVNIGILWRPLLHGSIVGSVALYEPLVSYTQPSAEAKAIAAVSPPSPAPQVSWRTQVQDLFPISIDEVRITRGTVSYRDDEQHLNLTLGSISAGVTNLTNNARASRKGNRVASFKAEGTILGNGHLRFGGDIDPFAKLPTFSLALALEQFDLTAINPLLIAYEKIHVNSGHVSIYVEMQSQNGKINGYLKPLFTDLSLLRSQDIHDKKVSVVKEAVAGAVADVFKNHPHDRFAGKLPLTGDLTDPKTSVLATLGSILRNAFIAALQPGFEHRHAPGEIPPAQAAEEAEHALSHAQKSKSSATAP